MEIPQAEAVRIPAAGVFIQGDLRVPHRASGLVIIAGDSLPHVKAPELLIVGGADDEVIEINRDAMRRMTAPMQLEIVPGARGPGRRSGDPGGVGVGGWGDAGRGGRPPERDPVGDAWGPEVGAGFDRGVGGARRLTATASKLRPGSTPSWCRQNCRTALRPGPDWSPGNLLRRPIQNRGFLRRRRIEAARCCWTAQVVTRYGRWRWRPGIS